MKKPPRKTTSGDRGRPRPGDAYRDAVLREKINAIHARLGGRAEASVLFEIAVAEGVFPLVVMQRFARRAGIEFVRGAVGETNPETGVPRSQPVRMKGVSGDRYIWIQLDIINAEEFCEVLEMRGKQMTDDVAEYVRLFEWGVRKFGRGAMPDPPRLDLPT